MIGAILNTFGEDVANCVNETNSILIEVYDCYDCTPALQKSYIKSKVGEPVHFTLNNPLATNLFFAALDNCILKANQQSRCDFIIGNFQKLYFVEIKQVNPGHRQEARTQAIRQLHSSISLFKGKINLHNTKLIAVICLKAKQVYPLQSAKRVADAVAFKDSYGADLMEGQSHNF
jgi:hypothetical protein